MIKWSLASAGTAAAVAIGCFVMVIGWMIGIPSWDQQEALIAPLPVNLAFFLFVAAGSIVAYHRQNKLFGFAAGLLISLLGFAIFFSYITLGQFDFIEILADNPYSKLPVQLDDFTPTARLQFLLTGISLFAMVKAERQRVVLLFVALTTIGVLQLASFALVGYFFDLSILSGTDAFGVPNLLQPITFSLLALTILFQVAHEWPDSKPEVKASTPLYIGAFCLLLTLTTWRVMMYEEIESARAKFHEVAQKKAIGTLDYLAQANKMVRHLAAQYPGRDQKLKQFWASQAIFAAKDIKNVVSLEIYGGDQTIHWTLPFASAASRSRKPAVPLQVPENLFKRVMQSKNLEYSSTFISPRAGIHAISIAAPVASIDGKQEGMLVATFHLEHFFDEVLSDSDFTVEVKEKQKSTLYSVASLDDPANASWTVSDRVPSTRVQWSIRVLPSNQMLLATQGLAAAIFLAIGTLFSLVCTLVFYYRTLAYQRPATPV